MNELKKKEICDGALALKKDIETSFLVLGEHLLRIKTETLFLPYYDSWSAFLDEIRLSESVASRLMGIYEKLILEYHCDVAKLASAGISNLQEILPHANTKEKAEEYLHLASTLTNRDLRIEMKELKTERAPCTHKNESSYLLRIYACGHKERVYEK